MVLAALASWIVEAISTAGYGGVLALMAIESACIPLPSEIIMPFAGYLVSTGRFTLWGAALAGAVGCNVGSTIAYYVGAKGGLRAIKRWGRLVLLEPADLDRAERFFHRYGGPAVFVARLLPAVRTFIALPAGMALMPPVRFQIYTFLGSFGWCWVLAYIGELLGRKWDSDPRLGAFLHRFDLVIVVVVALAIGWFVWARIRAIRRG